MLKSAYRNVFDRNYTPLGGSELSASQRRFKRSQYINKAWTKIIGFILATIFLIFVFRNMYTGDDNIILNENNLAYEVTTDIDSLLTSKHCENPAKGKPLVQYVLMIDAGSTGSRIHVYKFNYCKKSPELEDEVFEQIKPGLSSFDSDSEGAAKSLDNLMEVAMKNVPESLRQYTPVSVKATAGLRLLGDKKSAKILNAIEQRLKNVYPFPLAKEENPVAVMEGIDEGVYAWITVNYLLSSLGINGTDTAGTLDLGGGSAQIVFEPSFKSRLNGESPLANKHDDHKKFYEKNGPHKEFKYDFNYNKLDYNLYQNSYLGFGLMSARKKMFQEIIKSTSDNSKSVISHACFPHDFESEVVHENSDSKIKLSGTPKASSGNSTVKADSFKSNFEACLPIAKAIMNSENTCKAKPCTFNGVYQPDINDTFKSNPFYVFSYIYDRTSPFGLGEEFKLKDIKNLAEKVCKHDRSLFTEDEKKELESEKHTCFDLSYIYSLLRHGVGFSDERVLRTARKINDIETGWCLGAALAVLDKATYYKV
ncbi:putative guanosine-diphosphatase [Smittium culicis]|uniref:guanosine-diphosphatase n=1 Tax=Smittium culicis TaxID=133412 RepID=A0A1R1Y3H0_9FUNG|nr:putative guanosine-diphosphatase [Smittium culicis]